MKILLKNNGNEEFVWKDAIYKDGHFQYVNDAGEQTKLNLTDILSVSDDDRNKYVVCANCGELIKNTPKAIEKHFVTKESNRDCMSCSELYIGKRQDTIKRSYIKLEDDSYQITDKFVAPLRCGRYYGVDINSEKAINNCKYLRCRTAGVQKISDIFTEYPGVFDVVITTDMLSEKKWNYCGAKTVYNYTFGSYRQIFKYNGHLRETLYAVVNSLGLVEYFEVWHNRASYKFYYSVKYDKFFYEDCGFYKEGYPTNKISESKYESVCKKIRNLYKGADVDE